VIRGGERRHGLGFLSTAANEGTTVKRFTLSLAATALAALTVVAVAGATVTVPAVPVDDYGDALLSGLGTQLTAIFPYAAGVTVFAIGVGMVRRWLGHRKATKV